MSAQKIYASQNETAVIECPKCQTRKTVPVGQYKGTKFLMKVKCACSHVFEIEVCFRKYYRKSTNLDGNYHNSKSTFEGHYQSLSESKKVSPEVINCVISDLSFGGVSMKIMGRHLLEVGSKLLLTFHLDNSKKTLIQKKVVVKRIDGNIVGAEFVDTPKLDPELGFYLMP